MSSTNVQACSAAAQGQSVLPIRKPVSLLPLARRLHHSKTCACRIGRRQWPQRSRPRPPACCPNECRSCHSLLGSRRCPRHFVGLGGVIVDEPPAILLPPAR